MRAKWGNQARNLSKSKKEIKEVKKKIGYVTQWAGHFGQLGRLLLVLLLFNLCELWRPACINFAWDFRHLPCGDCPI